MMSSPSMTVCPMSPIGPGVCSTGVSSPSTLFLADMAFHEDHVSLWSALWELVLMAVPNMMAFVASFAVNLITFACLSARDEPKLLGAVGLGSLIGNIMGFAIGIGLTSVLDTLVSQAVGARNHYLAIVHLNRARIISVLVSIPCCLLMWQTEWMLVHLAQDPETSALAALFVQGTCWGLIPYFFCNALNSFMRCYGKTFPPMIINIVSSVFHFGITAYAINYLDMGAYGAGLCISITYWLRWILTEISMLYYAETRKAMKWTGQAWNVAGMVGYLVLAANNSVLMLAEWFAYELQALIAGWTGTEGLAAHVAGANVVTAVFMGAIGISQSAATMVGIALGKERPHTAKSFAIVAMCGTAALYTFIGLAIIYARNGIATLISSDPSVIETLHELLVVVGVFAVVDAVNGVGEGVLRGLAMQGKAVVFKLTFMFAVRLPLGYYLSKSMGVSGIWVGSIVAMTLSCFALAWVMSRVNFKQCSIDAIARQTAEKKITASGLLAPLNETENPFTVISPKKI